MALVLFPATIAKLIGEVRASLTAAYIGAGWGMTGWAFEDFLCDGVYYIFRHQIFL